MDHATVRNLIFLIDDEKLKSRLLRYFETIKINEELKIGARKIHKILGLGEISVATLHRYIKRRTKPFKTLYLDFTSPPATAWWVGGTLTDFLRSSKYHITLSTADFTLALPTAMAFKLIGVTPTIKLVKYQYTKNGQRYFTDECNVTACGRLIASITKSIYANPTKALSIFERTFGEEWVKKMLSVAFAFDGSVGVTKRGQVAVTFLESYSILKFVKEVLDRFNIESKIVEGTKGYYLLIIKKEMVFRFAEDIGIVGIKGWKLQDVVLNWQYGRARWPEHYVRVGALGMMPPEYALHYQLLKLPIPQRRKLELLLTAYALFNPHKDRYFDDLTRIPL